MTKTRVAGVGEARRLVLLALALAVVAGATWAPRVVPAETGVVRATRFELVDDGGRVVAELALRDGAPTLSFFDDEGRGRLVLEHGEEATGLSLLDDSETVRVGVVQFAHGGGGVALHGPASRGAAVLYYKESGSLTFYDGEGEVLQRLPAD